MRITLLVLAVCVPASAILYNIDQPVPISLAHAEYYASARLWGSGGVLMRFGLGLFDRVTLGMSYGGNRVIGSSLPQFYGRHRPDFEARLAIVQEQGYLPNLTLGFESQGYDDYVPGNDAYEVKEKGGYLCVGKTVDAVRTHLQFGVNYWDGLDAFVALNALLPGNVELIAEYDPALNDRTDTNRGFLNFGIGWTFADRVRMVVGLRDVLGNKSGTRLNRTLDISLNDRF